MLGPENYDSMRAEYEWAVPLENGATNNTAKLQAVELAVAAMPKITMETPNIFLLTDSQYMYGLINQLLGRWSKLGEDQENQNPSSGNENNWNIGGI